MTCRSRSVSAATSDPGYTAQEITGEDFSVFIRRGQGQMASRRRTGSIHIRRHHIVTWDDWSAGTRPPFSSSGSSRGPGLRGQTHV
jgi:hypothetical protein